ASITGPATSVGSMSGFSHIARNTIATRPACSSSEPPKASQGSSRRAAMSARLLVAGRLAHQPDPGHAGLLQHDHDLVDLAVVDRGVATDQHRHLRVLAHEGRDLDAEFGHLDRFALLFAERQVHRAVAGDAD